MKQGLREKLNKILTVVVILLAAVCLYLSFRAITGQDTSLFGFKIYHILTGSMEPTIPTGSDVLVKRVDPEKLKRGDVISFISRDSAIYGNVNTHRIIDIFPEEDGTLSFLTKGDANGTVDSITVPEADLKGKVIFHINFAGLSSFYDFVRTGQGFMTVVVFPMMFVIYCIMKDLKRKLDELVEEEARERLKEEEEAEEAEAEEEEPGEGEAEEEEPGEDEDREEDRKEDEKLL